MPARCPPYGKSPRHAVRRRSGCGRARPHSYRFAPRESTVIRASGAITAGARLELKGGSKPSRLVGKACVSIWRLPSRWRDASLGPAGGQLNSRRIKRGQRPSKNTSTSNCLVWKDLDRYIKIKLISAGYEANVIIHANRKKL